MPVPWEAPQQQQQQVETDTGTYSQKVELPGSCGSAGGRWKDLERTGVLEGTGAPQEDRQRQPTQTYLSIMNLLEKVYCLLKSN